jgi:hypothetical protein
MTKGDGVKRANKYLRNYHDRLIGARHDWHMQSGMQERFYLEYLYRNAGSIRGGTGLRTDG